MSRRPSLPDPSAVVAGRVRASIEQLFALIAEVNPTDRGLPSRVQAERYALKAKLQAVLVKQHAEVLEVVADGAPGVVSFRHRFADRDACHALVASLDDTTRRWVETELAMGRPPAPPFPAPAPASTGRSRSQATQGATDPLSQGLGALDDYDLDLARELLGKAFRVSSGRVEDAAPLIDLLVNQLCDDEAARALESSLSEEAAQAPAVRTLLALAAARLGDGLGALRWLRGVTGTEAADVLVVLADRAVREGDASGARDRIAAIRAEDAAHPALLRLGADLDRLRRDERAPVESALRESVGRQEWNAVESEARAILARWPESEAAKEALLAADRARRREQARALAGRASVAWERGDPVAVLRHIREARAVGAGDGELDAWLGEAEEAAQEAVQFAELAAVREGFARGDVAAALRGWIRLDLGARSEVAAEVTRVELRWLSELPATPEAVSAVLAMAEAEAALGDGDIVRARELLQPHLRLVRGTADGRALVALTEGEHRERARSATATALAAAEAALVAGDVDAAELALRGATPGDDVTLFRQQLARERQRQERTRELDSARRAGDVERARVLARDLGDGALADVEAWAEDTFRPRRWTDVEGTLRAFLTDNRTPMPRTWLSPDGRTVVLARAFGRWLVAWICDADTLAPQYAWTWRLPAPIRVSSWTVADDVLSVVGSEVALVQADWRDGRLIRWRAPVGSDDRIEGAALTPEFRYVWAVHMRENGTSEVRAYEVDRWPSSRAVDNSGIPLPLWGGTSPMVAVASWKKGVTIHHPSGRRVQASRAWMPDHRVSRASVNVLGVPLVVVADLTDKADQLRARQPAELQDKVVPHPAGVMYAEKRNEKGNVTTHPLSDVNMPHAMVPALAEDRVYVALNTAGQCAVSWVDAELLPDGDLDRRVHYFPPNAVLIGDVSGLRARVVAYTSEGLAIHTPDAGTPKLDEQNYREHVYSIVGLEGMDHDLGCGNHPTAVQSADVDVLVSALSGMGTAHREAWIKAFTERHAEDLDSQFHLAKALGLLGDGPESTRRIDELLERAPDHPQARYVRAWSAAYAAEWEEVWSAFEGVDFARFPGAEGQHARHLAGLAGLRTGRWERGAHLLREASWIPGRCNLGGPLGLIDVIRGDPTPDDIRDGAAFHLVRTGQLVRSLRAATEHLAAGEVAAAVADLDHALVWRADELQSTARLTEACLGVEGDGFARWLGVAALGGARHRYTHREARNLPMPEGAWGTEKLDEVEARATGWLEGGG